MFSEAVDSVMIRSGRNSATDRANIVDFVNSTVRECQTLNGSMFSGDLIEDTINITADPLIWTLPNRFRFMRTVRYPDQVYPEFLLPGKVMTDKVWYYYSAGTYMVFNGCGTSGTVGIAYYAYLPRLKYYATGTRPAVWDDETEVWTYLSGTTDPVQQELDRAKSTNWLLDRHTELIKEGALAKLFKMIKDEVRSVQSYSLYKQMQTEMLRSEAFETVGK